MSESINTSDIKYTLRLYDPSITTELGTQYEKTKSGFKNKNEFLAHLIELGLNANRKNMKSDPKRTSSAESEESDMYKLLLDIFKYNAQQFTKIYIDLNVLQGLTCTMYNILLALNNDERLPDKKVEDGFYDDLPDRFISLIDELKRRYGA